jgi:hypothetical protein
MAGASEWAHSQGFLNIGHHRVLVGKRAGFQLRVDQAIAHGQLETPSARRDESEALDGLFETRQQLGGQTDRFWLVVSKSAVFEANVHEELLWKWTIARAYSGRCRGAMSLNGKPIGLRGKPAHAQAYQVNGFRPEPAFSPSVAATGTTLTIAWICTVGAAGSTASSGSRRSTCKRFSFRNR